jgi:hypothetical protein
VDVNIDAIQSVVPRANPNEYAYAIGKSIKATTPDGKTVTAVRPNFVSDPSLSPVVTGVVSKLSIINGKYNISIQEPNGGLVDVNIDAIQSVVPRANPNEYAYAIGKSIKATTPDGKTVEGRVSTVAAQGGNIVVSVKGSDGKLTTISPSGIISLGE